MFPHVLVCTRAEYLVIYIYIYTRVWEWRYVSAKPDLYGKLRRLKRASLIRGSSSKGKTVFTERRLDHQACTMFHT